MPARKKRRRFLPFLFPAILFLYFFFMTPSKDAFTQTWLDNPPDPPPELIFHETKFNGLGAQLLRLLDAAALANATRSKLCVHQPRYWNYGCAPYHGWSCYFDSLRPNSEKCDEPDPCPSLGDMTPSDIRGVNCVTIDGHAAARAAMVLPGLDQARRLARDLWRPNAGTARAVKALVEEVAMDDGYIAMHIRRGDKSHEVRNVPLEKYVEIVRLLNATEVFVATDDGSVIPQLREMLHAVTVKSLPGAESRQGHYQAEFNSRYMKANYMPVVELLAEMEILRRGKYFVGTFSSNLARWVHVLRDLPANTSISLDDRWAPGVAWKTFGQTYCEDPDANEIVCRR